MRHTDSSLRVYISFTVSFSDKALRMFTLRFQSFCVTLCKYVIWTALFIGSVMPEILGGTRRRSANERNHFESNHKRPPPVYFYTLGTCQLWWSQCIGGHPTRYLDGPC